MNDLREVVVGLPGADLVPVPGPLGRTTVCTGGSCRPQVEHELISIGASFLMTACSAPRPCCYPGS